MERRKLITCEDLVEAPAQICWKCAGLHYVDHVLCPVCEGNGRIIPPPMPKSLFLLKVAVILMLAAAVGLYGILAGW
jgi:hypothetical protein